MPLSSIERMLNRQQEKVRWFPRGTRFAMISGVIGHAVWPMLSRRRRAPGKDAVRNPSGLPQS